MQRSDQQLAQERAMELLLPQRIEIVKSFTGLASFDDDATPDGIELYLRAINKLDNAGINVVGTLRVELYEHMRASGNIRGRKIDQWDISLQTLDDHKTYWNAYTKMYRFPLQLVESKLPSSRKFVLEVTYLSPWDSRLTDELVMELTLESLRRSGIATP